MTQPSLTTAEQRLRLIAEQLEALKEEDFNVSIDLIDGTIDVFHGANFISLRLTAPHRIEWDQQLPNPLPWPPCPRGSYEW